MKSMFNLVMTCLISYYQSNIIGVDFSRVSLSNPLNFIVNNLEKFSLPYTSKQKFKAGIFQSGEAQVPNAY